MWVCSEQCLWDKILSFEIASKLAHECNFCSNLALSSLVTGCWPPPQNVLVLKPTPMATHWVCLAAAGSRCQPLECILRTSVSACGLASWPAFSKVSSLDSSGSSTCWSCSCGTEAETLYRWAVLPSQKLLACTSSQQDAYTSFSHAFHPCSMWKRDVPLACIHCGVPSAWIDRGLKCQSILVNLTDTTQRYFLVSDMQITIHWTSERGKPARDSNLLSISSSF